MYVVYVLQNPDGLLYKGQTNDLKTRIQQHNILDGFKAYTKKRGPWKLVYKEEYSTRIEARAREKFFKSGKGRDFLKSHINGCYDSGVGQ